MNLTCWTISKPCLRVHSSLYAIKEDVDSLYEYMRALAPEELNPMIIPPDILKKIFHKIKEDIKSDVRLRLCEDPETNIWSYYGTVKLTPICSSRLLNDNFDCPSCRPISSDEFIQST